MSIPKDWPDEGFVRLPQIIGDAKANPPIPAVIPVSASTWWRGVRSGRYPKPVALGPNMTGWSISSIRGLFEAIESSDWSPKQLRTR